MRKPVVHLYTVCWDEADMLGFFFRHYDPFVDRYVVYDDGSTDGSRDILRAHPRVELRDFVRTDAESFVLSHRAMQNEAWKESRGQADWIVVTAIDEHLHVPGVPMAEYLAEEADRGVTLIPALGFDLNHPVMPDEAGLLRERVTRGRPRHAFNKLSLFKPEALRETGFGPGRHAAAPEGDLRLPARDTLVLWHYKHLGFERNAVREATQAERLGLTDRNQGFGQHYLWGVEKLRTFWDEMERESVELTAIVPDAVCVRPLWWEEQGLERAAPTPLPQPAFSPVPAAPAAVPTVSVLVKTYNHAPYIRQTIESVLAQSYQDFEIVVTDDGSTDGTADVVRTFSDPRIRLEGWPENRGISAAMNATVARARGRYLAILNSDDWALPGRLRRQVGVLDANPDIALVFGMPRTVDEGGLPTRGFNDFAEALRFPDFSRRTLLRHFFFRGNFLCAPTAMIRREAYEAAGAYDLRLTNLQDFDMWIRMLVADQRIHVLPDKLTAFRIRADHGNASAPSPEARLRSPYEQSRVLRHYAAFSEALFAEVFDADEVAVPEDGVALRVAEIARHVPNVIHANFALDTLFSAESAGKPSPRLRDWGGDVDALNIRAVEDRDARIARQLGDLAEREGSLRAVEAALARAMAEYAQLRSSLEATITRQAADLGEVRREEARLRDHAHELEKGFAAAMASNGRLRASLSWKVTVPLRWIERTVGRIERRLARRR